MAARTREALGWGLVGALTFLVLALGYLLLAEPGLGPIPLLGVAVIVFLAAAGVTYLLRPRLG